MSWRRQRTATCWGGAWHLWLYWFLLISFVLNWFLLIIDISWYVLISIEFYYTTGLWWFQVLVAARPNLIWSSQWPTGNSHVLYSNGYIHLPFSDRLNMVGGVEHEFYISIQLGISSSQLMNSYFSSQLLVNLHFPMVFLWFSYGFQ